MLIHIKPISYQWKIVLPSEDAGVVFLILCWIQYPRIIFKIIGKHLQFAFKCGKYQCAQSKDPSKHPFIAYLVTPLDSGYSRSSTIFFSFFRPYMIAVNRDWTRSMASSKTSRDILLSMPRHISAARSSHSSFW